MAHRQDRDLHVGVLLRAYTCIPQLGSPRKHGQRRGHELHSTLRTGSCRSLSSHSGITIIYLVSKKGLKVLNVGGLEESLH